MIRPRPFDLERGNRCSKARGRCATTHEVIQLSNDVRPIRDPPPAPAGSRTIARTRSTANQTNATASSVAGGVILSGEPRTSQNVPQANPPPGAARRGAARASAGPVANGYRARRRARAFGSRLSVCSRADVAGRRVELKRSSSPTIVGIRARYVGRAHPFGDADEMAQRIRALRNVGWESSS